jgi:hypothetical protein
MLVCVASELAPYPNARRKGETHLAAATVVGQRVVILTGVRRAIVARSCVAGREVLDRRHAISNWSEPTCRRSVHL